MRLAFTEGTLFILWFLKRHHDINIKDNGLINWLFSTSGYYDNQFSGSYFDIKPEECDKILISQTFNTYMETILEDIKNPIIFIYTVFSI